MSDTITERQQYWLNHIQAADKFDGTRVEYAKAEGLKVKDLYQWKTLLTLRLQNRDSLNSIKKSGLRERSKCSGYN